MMTLPKRWSELNPAQQKQVDQYIGNLLAQQTELPLIQKKGREVLERKAKGGVSYQLELIKCGKPNCKCRNGKLHGPYWYAYHREGKRLVCRYLGKTKPEGVENA